MEWKWAIKNQKVCPFLWYSLTAKFFLSVFLGPHMDVYNQLIQSGHSRSISLWENSLSFSKLCKQIFCPWFYRLSVTLYLFCFSEVPINVASKSNIQKQHRIYLPWNTRGQEQLSPVVLGHTYGFWVTIKPNPQPSHLTVKTSSLRQTAPGLRHTYWEFCLLFEVFH